MILDSARQLRRDLLLDPYLVHLTCANIFLQLNLCFYFHGVGIFFRFFFVFAYKYQYFLLPPLHPTRHRGCATAADTVHVLEEEEEGKQQQQQQQQQGEEGEVSQCLSARTRQEKSINRVGFNMNYYTQEVMNSKIGEDDRLGNR